MTQHTKILDHLAGRSRRRNRGAGDEARDQRNWPVAEREYRAHLDGSPSDQEIWIQYGHSLKEQSKLKEAETAYRKAIELAPEDAEAHLQLGHALKLMGDLDLAENAYKASLQLKPSKAAYDEIARLTPDNDVYNIVKGTIEQDAVNTIYLEIDDLLEYLRGYKTLSGIQRVQVGIIQHALHAINANKENFTFVRTGRHSSGFWRLNPGDLNAITDYISQSVVSQSQLRSLVIIAEERATLVEPRLGQTYLVLGAFWGFGSNAARYSRLKTAGVSVGVYIYDLIPVTHPEYCAAGLVSEFTLALGDGLYAFDFIFTISDFVAKDIRRFQKKHGLRRVPVEPVLLAHQLHDRPSAPKVALWKGDIAPLEGRPFVLMVSTIEARKNHIYLYSVWKSLIDEGFDPPDLVFVGRFGWRVNDLRDVLIDTEFLGGRIHVLHDISDGDLELLYRSCMFTAFPSIVEGWGLPVGESLAHGRPCVASNTSSVPEVGGDLVDYIDPWNVRDGTRVFKKMIFDDNYRASRIRQIEKRFIARTWDDVGTDLLIRLKRVSSITPVAYHPPRLGSGELLSPGAMTVGGHVPTNYAARPLRALLAESYYPPEAFGAWMRGHEGVLWFSSDCGPGTRISAYLHLVGAPWSSNHSLTLQVGKGPRLRTVKRSFPESVDRDSDTFKIDSQRAFLCRVAGEVEADGTVFIRFFVDGESVSSHPGRGGDDDRVFYVGLTKFGYCPSENSQLRVDLLERFSALV